MKTIISISKEANQLREKFQQSIVAEYIKANGGIKGFSGQIYLLLPKFDKRNPLYKGVSEYAYYQLKHYLFNIQSQRRFSHYTFSNDLAIVKTFSAQDFNICYSRVWHNGATAYGSHKHWAAQCAALFSGIEKYGFAYYSHDYNFPGRYYEELEKADPILVSIYTKIMHRKMAEMKVSHEN